MPEPDDTQVSTREFDARLQALANRMEAIRAEAAAEREHIREDMAISARVKVSRFEKTVGAVATLILIVSIGSVLLVVGGNLAEAERASCQRVIRDRLGTIKVRQAQFVAAGKIAQDPSQSSETRGARLAEARTLQASVNDLRMRVDPKNGGKLDCAKAFPPPGIFG